MKGQIVNKMLLVCYTILIAPLRTCESYIQDLHTNKSMELFQIETYNEFKDIPLLNRKIFRGYRVSIMEHPYVVSIRRQLSHYVTGAMVMNSLFLTVAQPVHGVPVYELTVVVGENYNDRGTAFNEVIIVVIHEKYNPNTLHANLAMVKIKEEIIFTMPVKPIRVIYYPPSDGNLAFASGWGRCDWSGKELCLPRSSVYYREEYQDPMLRTISFVINTTNSACDAYRPIGYVPHKGELCLGVPRDQDKMSPCLAVPGAPLVVNAKLVGLQSWGYACGFLHDLPVVYVDLFFYRRWILHNMEVFTQIRQEDATFLYIITKSYWMWNWLILTRQFAPTFHSYRDILQTLDIDKQLINLYGDVYDIRDSIYDNKYSKYKKLIYYHLKEQKKYYEKMKHAHTHNEPRTTAEPFIRLESEEVRNYTSVSSLEDDNYNDDEDVAVKLLLEKKKDKADTHVVVG